MESESTVSQTAGIDDLVDTQMGVEPSPATEAAQNPTVESSLESQASPPASGVGEQGVSSPEATQAGLSGVETASQPTSQPQAYRIGDRDYTVQEIQAAFTTAQQFPHLQGKYEELKGFVDRAPQSQAVQQQNQPGQQEQWLQQVQMKYQPEIKNLTDKGLISKDFAALFPAELSQMLAYRDGYQQLAQKVNSLEGFTQHQTQQAQTQGLLQEMSRNLQNLAQSGEAFSPLKEQGKVTEFVNYLWNLNPQVGHLRNPNFLASQWVAFNKDQYLTSMQNQMQQQARQSQQRFARADATTGSRPPGGFVEPVKTPLDQMVEEFLDRANS